MSCGTNHRAKLISGDQIQIRLSDSDTTQNMKLHQIVSIGFKQQVL